MAKETQYTPFCKCKWAFLQTPKPASGKFRSRFEITLVLDKDEHKELLRQISALNKDAGGPDKVNDPKHPIKADYKWIETDGAKGKQYIDGKYLVRFWTGVENRDHIMTYDSQGNVMNRDKNFIANDSVVSVAWSFGNYDGGVSLYLDGVQIKELIEWKGKDFEDLGFEKVQGYTSGDAVETADGFPVTTDDGGEQEPGPISEDDDLGF